MALLAEEDATCKGCGHPYDESMQPSAEGAYRARLIACHACGELHKAQQGLQDEEHPEPGIQIVVERSG